MGTKCAPLLADIFLHSHEADFMADLIRNKEHRKTRSFNISFRYIDDVLSLNNPSFGDLIHHRIYSDEFEIKDTSDTVKLASYLNLHLEIDGKGKILTNIFYGKRDDFSFIICQPFIVTTSLQYLRMEFSYHNSNVIPQLTVTTKTFCIWLQFLQLDFWNRVMLPQD